MKRKFTKFLFLLSGMILLGSTLTPFVLVIRMERVDLGGLFDLWPLIPIPITAAVILWLSYQYLNATEKTSL